MIAQSGSYWLYYTLLSVTPMYLNNILNYSLQSVMKNKVYMLTHVRF